MAKEDTKRDPAGRTSRVDTHIEASSEPATHTEHQPAASNPASSLTPMIKWYSDRLATGEPVRDLVDAFHAMARALGDKHG